MDPNELPLRDIHLPEPTGIWPLAPGWWVLIALAVIGFAWLLRWLWQRYQFNAPRRYAMRALAAAAADYQQHRNPVILSKQVSELLRRGMLAYAPRHEVAGLTGDAWLKWLDRGMPVKYFYTERGRGLLQLPYRDPQHEYPDVDLKALLNAARMRLETPLGAQH